MTANPLPAELKPENIVALIDTREQHVLDLDPLQTVAGTLTTGDYSVRGLEHVVAIERKSLPDLLSCVGQHRERFDREVQRLLAYPCRALVIEATWPDLERGDWRSKVTPGAALGSVLGWIAMGLPVVMAGDHERAGRYVSRLLFTAARRRWREARRLVAAVHENMGGRVTVQATWANILWQTRQCPEEAEANAFQPENVNTTPFTG